HADPEVEGAVRLALDDGWTLMGSGTTPWEGDAAELLVRCVPSLEKVQFTLSGSESTYHALRLARAFTGRDHLVVMQGGSNGRYGVVFIMDEVKTGFRHALGGYAALSGVTPDLAVYGKAIANGYPLGAIGGRAEIMDLFDHPDPAKRVLIAGTYNGHPVPTAA